MNTIHIKCALCMIIAAIYLSVETALFAIASQDQAEAPHTNDTFCGPRCVQFVLEQFKIDSDLIELVREIQWPEFESGATLKAVSGALEARGLHSCTIRVEHNETLTWSYPAIVHTNVLGSAIGHFHVWLPEFPERKKAMVNVVGIALLLAGDVLQSGEPDVSSSVAVVGCLDNMERLRSGACRIEILESLGGVQRVPTEIYTAFDKELDLNSLRFDRLLPALERMNQGGKYLRVGERSFQLLGIDSPGTAIVRDYATAPVSPIISPFDVRCLGLVSIGVSSVHLTPEKFFQDLADLESVTLWFEEPLTRISWSRFAGDAQPVVSELWLDANQGYCWVKYRNYSEKLNIDLDLETSWREQNGVFIPVSMRSLDKALNQEVIVTVFWENVNEEVDPVVFSPEGLVGESPLGMYSKELGQPVFLGTVGDDSAGTDVSTSPPSSLRLLMWLNMSVFAFVLVSYLFLRYKKLKSHL